MSTSLDHNAAEHPVAYDGEFPSLDDYLNYLMHARAFEEVLPLVAGKDVLDLGCNNGYGTAMLARAAAAIVGVDVSASAIADGRGRYPGLDLRVIDGERLPFDEDSFDVVISLEVIEHVDPDMVAGYLEDVSRVLRPGGVAAFTTPNASLRVRPGQRPWNEFHAQEFTEQELRAVLAAHFDTVEVRGITATPVVHDRIRSLWAANRDAPPPVAWKAAVKERAPWLVPIVRRLRSTTPELFDLGDYSTADFRYTDDLDDALDFLAVCSNG